jgi:hypothetical protein
MTSIARNKSKSKSKKNKDNQLDFDDKIDEIMKDITLKRPRNPYTQFVLDQVKSKDKGIKLNIPDLSKECSEKWQKLKDQDKKKFAKLFEDEKIKYKADIELVRHYLFKDFNDTVCRAPTAYRIFLNEKLREGFEQGTEPKDVKKEAASLWLKMSQEEKAIYFEKKKENDNWFLKANKIKKVTPIALFIQKKLKKRKKNTRNLLL